MRHQTTHQRIMDNDAVGPMQQTIDQQTYIDAMPHVGRTDPVPTDFALTRQTRGRDGSCYYDDLYSDGSNGWAVPDDPLDLTTWGAIRP